MTYVAYVECNGCRCRIEAGEVFQLVPPGMEATHQHFCYRCWNKMLAAIKESK